MDGVVDAIKVEIEKARRKPDGTPKAARSDPDLEAAVYWRKRIAAAGGNPDKGAIPDELEHEWEAEIGERLGDPIGEEEEPGGGVEYLYDPAAERRTNTFVALVKGRLPVGAELDRYLNETELASSYRSRTKLAVRRLEEWSAERPDGNSVPAISRREAGLFVDHLAAQGITTATVNSQVSALSAYWKWMQRRGNAAENPWAEQQRTPKGADLNARKRPFTDDEVSALLAGDTYSTLHDLMRLAALSGMRLNEITQLRVQDVSGGVFRVTDAKTTAGIRRVPVHPSLVALVARRSDGKSPSDFLLEELGASPSRQNRRGAKVGERFTSYRRTLGLDERLPGRRQANADFHSFRRWFITKMEQANVTPHIIAAVVGHEEGREFLALTTYSGGPSDRQLTNAVERVRLPRGAPEESPGGPRMGQRSARGRAQAI